MKKFLSIFVFLYLVFIPSFFIEGATTNTGFIPGQIWYSKDPFFEGETIKIYTAIWNNDSLPLSAKVEFYDKNVVLGTRDIVVPALQIKEVYISWKVTSGDHLISAKIISPSVTSNGKKQSVIVNSNTTESDKRFIPIVAKTADGKTATSTNIIKNQVDKAASSIEDILPDSVSEPVSENIGVINNFRENTFKKITDTKTDTKKQIEELNKVSASSTKSTPNTNVGIEDATEKPIAYLKLFFLSILSFVFGSKLVFYLVLLFVLFMILRFIYRKIRNKY